VIAALIIILLAASLLRGCIAALTSIRRDSLEVMTVR